MLFHYSGYSIFLALLETIIILVDLFLAHHLATSHSFGENTRLDKMLANLNSVTVYFLYNYIIYSYDDKKWPAKNCYKG